MAIRKSEEGQPDQSEMGSKTDRSEPQKRLSVDKVKKVVDMSNKKKDLIASVSKAALAKKKVEDFEKSTSRNVSQEQEKEKSIQDGEAAKMSKNTSTISKKDKLITDKEDKQIKTQNNSEESGSSPLKPDESKSHLIENATYINRTSEDGGMSEDSPAREVDPSALKRTYTRMKKQREYNEKKHMDALYNLFPD